MKKLQLNTEGSRNVQGWLATWLSEHLAALLCFIYHFENPSTKFKSHPHRWSSYLSVKFKKLMKVKIECESMTLRRVITFPSTEIDTFWRELLLSVSSSYELAIDMF